MATSTDKKTKTVTKKTTAAKSTSEPAADVKTVAPVDTKKEETKTVAKSEDKIEDKNVVAETEKKEVAKKETAKKTAAKKETVKKETAKKETAKKETAKKETVKKETEKKEAVKTSLTVQFADKNIDAQSLENAIVEKYVAETGKKASSIKDLKIYVKPVDYRAYYVINDEEHSSIGL